MTGLVLIRHAERALTFQSATDGLSERGREQSRWLAEQVGENLVRPTRLVASPRIRTHQTMAPIAEKTNLLIEIEDLVNERESNETRQVFEDRVRSFLTGTPTNQITFVCTHSDWLDSAMLQMQSDVSDETLFHPWAVAEARVFILGEHGMWTLRKIIVAPQN